MDRKTAPTEISARARQNITRLITERCDGSQQRFADKSGIGKSSVSQYVNGSNVPGNLTAEKIGRAFDVNPAWVMGFDVPMEAEPEKKHEYYLNEETKDLIDFLYSHPEYKVLFDASRKVKLEDIDFVKRMIDKFGGE